MNLVSWDKPSGLATNLTSPSVSFQPSNPCNPQETPHHTTCKHQNNNSNSQSTSQSTSQSNSRSNSHSLQSLFLILLLFPPHGRSGQGGFRQGVSSNYLHLRKQVVLRRAGPLPGSTVLPALPPSHLINGFLHKNDSFCPLIFSSDVLLFLIKNKKEKRKIKRKKKEKKEKRKGKGKG